MPKRYIRFIVGVFTSVCLLFPISVSAQTQLAATGQLAVTPVGYDNIGAVLSSLGFSATEISESQITDLATLLQYDSVYLNCSDTLDTGIDLDAAAAILRQYVEAGGTLYASDYANSLITKAFPGKLSFYQDADGFAELGRVGGAGVVQAQVTDAGLAAVLGTTSLEVNFDIPAWAVIDSVGAGVTVHVTGPATAIDFSDIFNIDPGIDLSDPATWGDLSDLFPATPIGDKPFAVSFSHGQGEVLYTSFHNEAQHTSNLPKVLTWFAVRVLSGNQVRESRDFVSQSQGLTLQEVVDSVTAGEPKAYTFESKENQVLDIVLNSSSGKFKLTLVNPAGEDVFSEEVTVFPFSKTITAVAGNYTAKVEGLETSQSQSPFVLTIAKSSKAATDTALSAPMLVQAIEPYLGILTAVVIVLLVLGALTSLWLLDRMRHRKSVSVATNIKPTA